MGLQSNIIAVTQNPMNYGAIQNSFDPRYDVTLCSDISEAIENDKVKQASVVVIDQNGRRDSNIERFVNFTKSMKKNIPNLIVVAGHSVTHDVNRDDVDTAVKLLNWPLPARRLQIEASALMNKTVEREWLKLPELISKPLTTTVQEFHAISLAIQKGEAVDINNVASSCRPIVDCVGNGMHHNLLSAVQSHHDYTYVHSLRVSIILTLFGYALGLSESELITLSTGGILHDVGKIKIPLNILDKSGKLDGLESSIMRGHATVTMDILKRSNGISNGIMIIASQHHEKLDGNGYPIGLKGGEINDLARMAAIADIFGALTDVRSYKPAFSADKAFHILEGMENQIDQKLLRLFRQIFQSS